MTGNVTLNILGNTLVEGLAVDYEGNLTGGNRGGVFGGGDAGIDFLQIAWHSPRHGKHVEDFARIGPRSRLSPESNTFPYRQFRHDNV